MRKSSLVAYIVIVFFFCEHDASTESAENIAATTRISDKIFFIINSFKL